MRPLIAMVSKSAILFNIQKIKNIAPSSRVCVIVKADAYGHRCHGIIHALNQADYLAVACLEEAILLQQYGGQKPIVLLEGVFEEDEYHACFENHLEPVITHAHQLQMLENYLSSRRKNDQNNSENQTINIWLKLDTGMNRLGLELDELNPILKRLNVYQSYFGQINLMSHFACADEAEHELNARQIEHFDQGLLQINAQEYAKNKDKVIKNITYKSMCNSAAILNFSDRHYDLVRSGLITYGISPFENQTGHDLGFLPVMTLKSKIISLKQVKKGQSIGYGAQCILTKDAWIAVVACGYADGYPREVSKAAYVKIALQDAPIIGAISMDMMMIDVTDIPSASIGDDVILWGAILPIEWVAKWANTISYTLVTGISGRVSFQFVD